MGVFSLFKRQRPKFFSPEEKTAIIEAIRAAEKSTSGEIRVYIESHNRFVDAVDRASEVFFSLKMEKTQHRNGVLLYIAMKDHQLAIFADEGIYKIMGQAFWDASVKEIIEEISTGPMSESIIHCITKIGEVLTEKFPYQSTTDKNELPDDIVFGH